MMRLRPILFFLLFAGSAAAGDRLIGARFPALSPDGNQIAFSYMGDLWKVSSLGGRAVRLTDHVAYDRQPVWSPDGSKLVFSSNRFGNFDLFIIPSGGGVPVRLTYHSGDDMPGDFSQDGKWIYFQSTRSSGTGIYRIPVNGGNPDPVLDTYWNWSYSPRISPDGRTLLFSFGMENSYWWRKGYRGSNSARIWTKELDGGTVESCVSHESNSFWPNWISGGSRFVFVSDRESGVSNIWSSAQDGSDPKPVTRFGKDDVRWLSAARNVPQAVYERTFGIWITNLETGESHEVIVEAPAETKENKTFFVQNDRATEFKLSPDAKKIAAVVRGEIFVFGTEGGYSRNVTLSSWRERDVQWNKESTRIIFVSDMDAKPELYDVSAMGNEDPRRLTRSREDVLSPRVSPNGEWIAYYSGARELRLIRPDGKDDRLLMEADFGGRFSGDFVWSPDSRYLASTVRRNADLDIVAVNIEDGKQILLTNTAYDEESPQWSSDGKFILFRSNRYGHSFPEFTGKWDLYQVHLEPDKPRFKESRFEKMFESIPEPKKEDGKKTEGDKKEKPETVVQFRLQNLDRQTLQITNTLGDDGEFVLSPKDTNTVYFVSDIDGKNHLWVVDLKDEDRIAKPFMPQINNPQNLQMDSKGNDLYCLSEGRISRIKLGGLKSEPVSFDSRIEVDKTRDYEQMLAEIFYTLQYYYYDANHHRTDWKAMYEKYRPVLEQVREDLDFADYVNEMIGTLNSSHTGFRLRPGRITEEPSAHLGLVWSISGNAVRIEKIIKDGPFYDHGDSVAVGDILTEIDGKKIDPQANLWAMLNGKLNKRVQITVRSEKMQKEVRLSMVPISSYEENRLLLEEWIDGCKAMVKAKTQDQIAYCYMRAMGYGDLQRFLKELERDGVPRKGLILDLRYNFGGNVHDRVLEALMKPVYAAWRIRGLSETKQSTYGFADKPVVLITNEVTLSDGEMTANGFKVLKRGTIVGNTTYGWLIFTTEQRLLNGSSFRLPFWGCYTLDGKDLETMGGVVPDVRIINDLNHNLSQEDPQLEKAIELILSEIR